MNEMSAHVPASKLTIVGVRDISGLNRSVANSLFPVIYLHSDDGKKCAALASAYADSNSSFVKLVDVGLAISKSEATESSTLIAEVGAHIEVVVLNGLDSMPAESVRQIVMAIRNLDKKVLLVLCHDVRFTHSLQIKHSSVVVAEKH